eukprot:9004778-Heterocapsa_arctica.AAC.1
MTYLEAVVLPDGADGPKDVNELDQQKWCLLEWACDPKSRLAEWFVQSGHHAVRLGLPGIDLSQWSC